MDTSRILLKQYSGYSKGLQKVLPVDVVLVDTEQGPRKIGFVDRKPNATLRFIHFFDDAELAQAIRRKVAELRKEQGGFPISELTVGPPNPKIIRGYLKGEKFRERPTTVVMPDGTPAGTVTEMTGDDSEVDWGIDDE